MIFNNLFITINNNCNEKINKEKFKRTGENNAGN